MHKTLHKVSILKSLLFQYSFYKMANAGQILCTFSDVNLVTDIYMPDTRVVNKDWHIRAAEYETLPTWTIHCCARRSIWAAATLFMPSWVIWRLVFHAWSRSRSCCYWALPNVRCIVLEMYTLRAAWSMRALTSLVFRTAYRQNKKINAFPQRPCLCQLNCVTVC